jgi:hypothetical protein
MRVRFQFDLTHSCPAAYSRFSEWNPRPEIAEAAERLYGHIDNLELYVGLQAEETKPVVEGAGLCPGAFASFGYYRTLNLFSSQDTLSVALFLVMPWP